MRAAIYARYSSDRQSDRSIDDQVRLCRERIAREGWTFTEIYADYAISGATKARPGLLQLLDDARERRLDVVVTEALDRLSRDQEDTAGIFKRLRHHQVSIISLAEGEIGALHVGMAGTMNALYLEHLAEKTRRGMRGRIEDGRAAGGIGYGYRMVAQADGTRGSRAIEPDQAAVVRRIFRDYVAGVSPRAIAAALNREGVPAPRGGEWNASTINGNPKRGNGVLWNELYIGQLIWNRQRFVKDPDSGKRQAKLNPRSEWVIVEAPELRIVDDELWQAAQRLKARLAPEPVAERRRTKRLLSGLVFCGACGASMTIVSGERFGCFAHRERGTCSNGKTITVGKLERLVIDGLKRHLMAPDLVAAFVEEYQLELRRLASTSSRRRAQIDRRLNDTASGIRRIVTAIEHGTDTPSMHQRLIELEGEKARLEDERRRLGEPAVVEMHPGMAEAYRREVEDLQQALNDDTVPEERHRAITLLRSLVERIILTPGEGRGELAIDLVGDLWSVMQMARRAESQAGQIDCTKMVVAGAGFEPTTFRL